MGRRSILFGTIGILVLALAGPLRADPFTYALAFPVNGDLPQGTPTATFQTVMPGLVELTMDLTGTPADQFASLWYFNFSGTGAELDSLAFAFQPTSTGPSAASIQTDLDGFGQGNGFGNQAAGLFDIALTFSTSNAGGGALRFNGGETVVYRISSPLLPSLSASFFHVGSTPGPDGLSFYTAADFQGIPGASSGVLGAIVPEPSSVILVGLGLGVLGLAARRRRGCSRLPGFCGQRPPSPRSYRMDLC